MIKCSFGEKINQSKLKSYIGLVDENKHYGDCEKNSRITLRRL